MISFTINYSKFETLIRIDIENRPEQTIIPAFSIGLELDYKLFGHNYLNIDQNHTRKILSNNKQHKILRKCFDLRIGDKILDSTAISKSIDLRKFGTDSKVQRRQQRYFNLPISWSTFHLNLSSLEFRAEKKSNEILSILFNNRSCEEIDIREKYFHLLMHSIEHFIDTSEYLEITRSDYIPPYNLRGTKRIHIKNGKESCSHYDSNDRPFDAISRSICLRKCFQEYCQKKFRCSPLIIKSIISSIDEEENELKLCSRKLNNLCEKEINSENIRNQCIKYCPKDCIDFEIKQTNAMEFVNYFVLQQKKDITNDFFEVHVFWDKKYPLITYIETPVMSFTEYLCYCGGLLGLWFGSNAYQVMSYVIDSRNWILLKNALQTFGRILIAMIWAKINIFLNFVSNFRIRLTIDIEW
jgi:hypothetical protein